MGIKTRLTDFFGLEHPIILAPMDPASGGELASAVSAAGALGMLGGGYANRTFRRSPIWWQKGLLMSSWLLQAASPMDAAWLQL